MKYRNGFVSNSSSSSFIITTTKENFDRAFSVSDDYIKKIITEMGYSKKELLGKKLVSLSTWSNMNGVSNFDYMDNEKTNKSNLHCRDPWEAFEEFCDKLRESKNEVMEEHDSH